MNMVPWCAHAPHPPTPPPTYTHTHTHTFQEFMGLFDAEGWICLQFQAIQYTCQTPNVEAQIVSLVVPVAMRHTCPENTFQENAIALYKDLSGNQTWDPNIYNNV